MRGRWDRQLEGSREAHKTKVGAKTDTDEPEKEREICRCRLRQTIGAKNKLAEQMDALDVSDKFYDRKYEGKQDRMDKLYEEIGAIEDEIDTISMRIDNINKKQLSKDSIYRILKSSDKIYSEFTDAERLVEIYNASFYSDYIKYGECPAYGRTKEILGSQ